MRFEIQPLPGETARAHLAMARSTGPQKMHPGFTALGVGIVIAAYYLTPASPATTTAIACGAMFGTVLLLQRMGKSNLERLHAVDPHALAPHYVEVDETGVRCGGPHFDARAVWPEIARVVETKEFYVFARASGTGASIPKRVLAPVTEAALRDRIRQSSPDRGAGLDQGDR